MTAEVLTLPTGRGVIGDPIVERDVLGSILLDARRLDEVSDFLRPEHFVFARWGTIFAAMLDMRREGQPVELVTLRAALLARGDLDRVGGDETLLSLSETIPISQHVEHYARRVYGYAVQRAIVDAARQVLMRGIAPLDDVGTFALEAEAAIARAAAAHQVTTEIATMKSVVIETFERVTERAEGKETAGKPVPLGWPTLDRKLGGGARPGDLVLIGARPGMGKTAFGLAAGIALARHGPVPVFSLEMSRWQLGERALSHEARVDGGRIRTAMLTRDDWTALTTEAGRLASLPLFVEDTPSITVEYMRAVCRRLTAKHGRLAGIVVDYVQLLRTTERYDSREQQIAHISRTLKAIAKELEAPVLALVQLNRKLEERSDKRPMLSDLRESGALEQDADVVLFLYREEVYKPQDTEVRGVGEIIIGKQRNGPTGTVRARWHAEYTRFDELDASEREAEDAAPFGQGWDPQSDWHNREDFRD